MHGRGFDKTMCTPARGLQLRMCDCMVALQAREQVLLTASAVECLALKLCCVCGLLARLRPCHGAIEGAQHVCRPACLQPKLLCLQAEVNVRSVQCLRCSSNVSGRTRVLDSQQPGDLQMIYTYWAGVSMPDMPCWVHTMLRGLARKIAAGYLQRSVHVTRHGMLRDRRRHTARNRT